MATPVSAVYFQRSPLGLPPSWYEEGITHPRAIMPWTAEVQQNTVVHEILNGTSPDVTLRAPSTRAGTMRLLYFDATEAENALDVFSYPSLFVSSTRNIDGSGRPVWMPEYFAAIGTLRLIDDEASTAWWLEVGWQAV